MHEGGIATPLIVHWPKGIKARGELRHDLGHVIDFVPTLLDLAGGRSEGTLGRQSPRPRFRGAAWCRPLRTTAAWNTSSSSSSTRATAPCGWGIGSWCRPGKTGPWELYDLANDRCEKINLADREPNRVQEMAAKWTALEAEYRRQAGPVIPFPKQPNKWNAVEKSPFSHLCGVSVGWPGQ